MKRYVPNNGKVKDWGYVTHVLDLPFLQVDDLHIYAGGFSSIHLHKDKINLFYVVKGRLAISFFKPGEATPYRLEFLHAGDQELVHPNLLHRFACLDECRCIEVYWPKRGETQCSIRDIHRIKPNGLMDPKMLPEGAAWSCLGGF